MSLVLTPIGSDSFNRPDENPLDPTHWSSLPPVENLQIVGHICESAGDVGAEIFNTSAPNDQYAQGTIAGDTFALFLLLRHVADPNQYVLAIGTSFAVLGKGQPQIFSPGPHNPSVACTPQIGDVFTFAIVGSVFNVLQNGTRILTALESTIDFGLPLTSGLVGLGVHPEAGTYPGWSNFEMGSASLTGSAPSITSQPQDVTLQAGNMATFSVVASGDAPLGYQWRKNGTPIAGATSSSYTTPQEFMGDDGATFDVVVSNLNGVATSNAATLKVSALVGSWNYYSDLVKGQPVKQPAKSPFKPFYRPKLK